MKHSFAILLCAAALVACTKTPQDAAKLEVGATSLNVPATGTVQEVSISTDVEWTAELSADWVVAAKVRGNGNSVLKLAVMPNADFSAREAILTVKAGTLSKTVTITQAQLDGIFIDGDQIVANYVGGDFEIPVQSNVNYTVTTDVPWLVLASSKALSESSIPVTMGMNIGREARQGHISIAYEDEMNVVVTVTQGAFEPYFDLEDEQGVGLWGTLQVPQEGMTYTFTAVTNMEFYAEAPDADWIDVSVDGEVVTVTIAPNEDASRIEYIYMGCYIEDEDYSDYGAMIKVSQKGNAQAVPMWEMDFYWGIFPQSTRVSAATVGDYLVMYAPGFITPGFHVYDNTSGMELQVIPVPEGLENVTGITNDDAGNIILTTGGTFPLKEDWSLDEEAQIPLQVYVMTAEDFMNGNIGAPVITYYDEFYGYGLDNARVRGDVFGDACLSMLSGGAYGGSYILGWEFNDGATTDAITDYVTARVLDDDSMWDSFHGVGAHVGTTVDSGVYFAGYVVDYNIHYNPTMSMANWALAFETGYSWEGAVNTMDIFDYNGHTYLATIGMNYFSFADWDYDEVVDDYLPNKLWIFNIDDPASPVIVINEEFYATEGNWCYGDNCDIRVVQEADGLMAYVINVCASTYRKYRLDM